jgi:hypothetical protein
MEDWTDGQGRRSANTGNSRIEMTSPKLPFNSAFTKYQSTGKTKHNA